MNPFYLFFINVLFFFFFFAQAVLRFHVTKLKRIIGNVFDTNHESFKIQLLAAPPKLAPNIINIEKGAKPEQKTTLPSETDFFSNTNQTTTSFEFKVHCQSDCVSILSIDGPLK